MAFARNFGSLLRQSISRHTSSNGSTIIPSIYQALRCMSSSRLFVGGLPYVMDEQALRESFTEFGEVTEARVIYDRESGRSRGFGFISFTSDEEAAAAIGAMDGKQLNGRIVHVNYATERRGFGGGGGSYSGGYGSGGGSYSGGYSQNDSYGSGGGYSQNDSYGGGGGYRQNDSYGSGGGGGGYSQNTSYGSGVGSYGGNDGYGNSGGYNQNDGGYGQNDGLGSSTSGTADGKVGYDDEPRDTISNIGKGY